jgi:hypothetical protein
MAQRLKVVIEIEAPDFASKEDILKVMDIIRDSQFNLPNKHLNSTFLGIGDPRKEDSIIANMSAGYCDWVGPKVEEPEKEE